MSWITNWIDARIAAAVKAAINQANTDISADITAIGKQVEALPAAISANISSMISLASADLDKAIDDVPNLVNTVLTQGVLSAEQLATVIEQALNPQTFANEIAQAIKQISGGLLTYEEAKRRFERPGDV